MHIDGDVYIPRGLPPEIESGDLIAQNAEIGTLYYKDMATKIMKNSVLLPDVLLEELKKESISSYNAGVIGGSGTEDDPYQLPEVTVTGSGSDSGSFYGDDHDEYNSYQGAGSGYGSDYGTGSDYGSGSDYSSASYYG